MSLMLHSAYGEKRMRDLAQVIIDNGLQTITYRMMMDGINNGVCPPENAIIVSLDDMGTSWLRPVFKDMIKEFTDKGLVLVAGVVTHSEQDPGIWAYLHQIENLGIEVASHSINHLTFTSISDQALEKEITGSYEMICEHLGTCPITLILPGGHGGDDPRVYDIADGHYAFLVGIQGGRAFSAAPPYYLGRIPPNNDDQVITLTLLENSFLP
jgi:peptidoglycan/xylan/chitin deacetylase (PgdA/CDA1 family)